MLLFFCKKISENYVGDVFRLSEAICYDRDKKDGGAK